MGMAFAFIPIPARYLLTGCDGLRGIANGNALCEIHVTAGFWSSRMRYDSSKNSYRIEHAVSVDEGR